MWITEFCARRSSDCVEQAEACNDPQRRQAWLRLAEEWGRVADGAVAFKRGGASLENQVVS